MTTWGGDASYFQRPKTGQQLDLRALPAQGYEFWTCRIAYGASFKDPAWPTFRQQAAQGAALLFSGYHFLTGASAQQQADLVASWIGDKRIPVDIDYESGSAVGYGQVEKFATAAQANGLKIGRLYYPRSWWMQTGRPSIPSHWGLWNAAYPSSRSAFASLLYPGDGHANWQPYGGHAVDAWQFASSALLAGYHAGVDVNAYRGTRAQLASTGWFHDYTPAPPPPPPKPPTPPVPPTPENDVSLSDADIKKIAAAVRAEVFTVDAKRLGWANPKHTAGDLLYATLVLSSDTRAAVHALAKQVAQIPGSPIASIAEPAPAEPATAEPEAQQ